MGEFWQHGWNQDAMQNWIIHMNEYMFMKFDTSTKLHMVESEHQLELTTWTNLTIHGW
jgi:hypothetical protein